MLAKPAFGLSVVQGMFNTYLRLVIIAAVVLVALGIVAFLIPLLIKAAILAAVVFAILFLINLFRRRCQGTGARSSYLR